ncbi:MAG: SirB1 family protein [Limisphaerales bacterium]
MNTPDSQVGHPPLTDSQKAALVKLLEDEDPAVYEPVRRRILAAGTDIVPSLQAHVLTDNPLLRRRVREILSHYSTLEADTRFLAFCLGHGSHLDLEKGVWLLAQTRHPDFSIAGFSALLDTFAAEIRHRLGPEPGATEALATINQYLFEDLGFRGNQENYYDPENSYFNRVIERRTGNPITLCTLYWLVARRLRLPIVGVAMPGHFLCRYQTPTDSYFIDAFNRGKLLSRANCVSYLQQSKHGYEDSHLMPATPARTLLRMCSNLHQVYAKLERPEETARVQRYLIALSRHTT